MRIAIVTETWPPEINGVALTVQSLAQGLAALGHSIEIVRPRQDEAGMPDDGLDHLQMPGAALPRYPGLRFGLPAHRRLRIPVSTGFHTRFDDYARHYGLGFLTPIVYAYLRRFHNRADATLVPTAELAEFLEANRFRNVRLLRRAVDTTLFHPRHRDEALRREWGLGADDLAVIYVGRIAPEKNLELAVRAFRAIKARQPSARFVLVGDGPARKTLAAAHPDFIFAGMRRGEALSRHYASADLFLFPSLSETFGNVTLEALASGVPVVAYDYGAAREHMRGVDVGACIAPRAGDEFVDAAVALAGDAPRRVRLRASAREVVEALDPSSVATSFADLLAGLATRRAA